MVPDLAEVWLSQLEADASLLGLSFDDRFLRKFEALCPICGQFTAERDPYPGVRLQSYYFAAAGTVIPYWGCACCVNLPDDLVEERLRCRFAEFLTD